MLLQLLQQAPHQAWGSELEQPVWQLLLTKLWGGLDGQQRMLCLLSCASFCEAPPLWWGLVHLPVLAAQAHGAHGAEHLL